MAKQRKNTAHHPRFGSCDGEVCLGDRDDGGGGAGVVESLGGVRKKCHLRMQIAVTRRIVTRRTIIGCFKPSLLSTLFFAFQVGVPHFDEFVAKAGKLHSTLK